MRKVAIFRFSPTEGPAYFADWLDRHGVGWKLIALDRGEAVPTDPRAWAGIGMMGGPMSVNDSLPWIDPLCALLREAVAAATPVIGHCLGGQLLARALGAPVARARVAEIGWIDVDVAAAPAAGEWFGGRSRFETFQWHYDAFALPAGAVRLLTNEHNPNQAFAVDGRHIGLQCHVEMTRDLVETWLASGGGELPPAAQPQAQQTTRPAPPAATQAAVQPAATIRHGLDAHVASLNAVAGDIYARWAQRLPR